MTGAQVQGLVDDQGAPVRWKVATMVAVAGLILTLVLTVAGAGARSERWESAARKVEKFEASATKVERLDAWKDGVDLRLKSIEEAQREIQKDQREILRRLPR